MTQEGIIQKVLAEFFYDCLTRQRMEKRLIEEIEKHAFFTACDISLNVVELDKLIGETKA